MAGLAFTGAFVSGLIIAFALVPKGDTLQDAEEDASDEGVLFGVLCILVIVAAIAIVGSKGVIG